MRIAYLLTGGALALAAPVLAQTPGRVPLPPEPAPAATPAPTSDMGTMPQTPGTPDPAATGTPPTGTGVQQATPSGDTAPATTPIPPTVGATVYGAAGVPVGTIKAMDSQYVTLATEKGEVRLPVAGVGPGLKGPVIGLTAAQLDAAVTQAQAAQPAPAATTTTKTRTTRRR